MKYQSEYGQEWEDSDASVGPIRLLTLAEAARGKFDDGFVPVNEVREKEPEQVAE